MECRGVLYVILNIGVRLMGLWGLWETSEEGIYRIVRQNPLMERFTKTGRRYLITTFDYNRQDCNAEVMP